MKRRVLHVIPFLWSGAGRVVTRLCEEQARGADVHIATSGHSGTERDWPAYRRRLARAGVTWHRVNSFDRQPESLWPAIVRATALVRALRPDVVHAHAGVPTLVSTLAIKGAGSTAPVIAQMYSWGPNRPEWMDTMDLLGFSRADRVVVSARQYERLLIDGGVGRSRLTYIPWGVDLPPLNAGLKPRRHVRSQTHVRGGRALALPSTLALRQPIRFGFVGRLEPRKDQLTLVETIAELVKRGVDAHLTLVGPDGDAAYGNAVRSAVATLGLSDRVQLTGSVRSVWPHLQTMDAFVSLSKDEGQGLAVLEAMGAGVPVLARPAAGLEDFLVDGKNGLWLQGSRAHPLGKSLAAAVSDRSRLAQLTTRARRMVKQHYTWPATLRALETVYGW